MTALFFTFSRGAWAGAIVGVLILLIIAVVKKDLWKQQQVLKLMLISGIMVFLLFLQYQDLVLTRLSQDTRLEVKSTAERVTSYQTAWQIIKKHPVFGVGLGNYTLAVKNGIAPDQPSWYYQPAHNAFLLVWAEIGMVGLIFFFLLLFVILISNIQYPISNKIQNPNGKNVIENLKIENSLKIGNWKLKINNELHQDTNFKSLALPLIASFAVMSSFDHWWWSLHFGVLLFWFLLGVMNLSYGDMRSETQNS